MFIVKVERLTGKFCGMVEDLPRYCIKHQGELSVGMEVEIGQRRCSSKARVVEIKKPALKTRTTVNAELRATLRRRRPSKIPICRRPSRSPTPVTSPATDLSSPIASEVSSVPSSPDAGNINDVSRDFANLSMDLDSDNESGPLLVHRCEPSAFQPVPQPVPVLHHYGTNPRGLEDIVAQLVTETRALHHQNAVLHQQNQTLQQQNQAMMFEFAELRKEVRELKGQRQEKASPKYTTLADDQVLIGSSDASVTIGREVYLRAWESSSDAKDLVLRLVSTQFTREELAASNFNGGDVFNGKERTTKRGLREDSRFQAILAQAVIQFPGSLTNDQQRKQLRDAVNNKCRKSACLLR